MLSMFSLPLRHPLRLRRCLHRTVRTVLYSLGSHFTIVYVLTFHFDSMLALLDYYMAWIL